MTKVKKVAAKKVAKKALAVTTKRPAMSLVQATNKPAFTSMAKLANEKRDDTASQDAKNMLLLACQVFEIPPQGVNIMGGQPYINKVGWKIKKAQYYEDSTITLEWIHRADPKEKWAIVDATLNDKDGKFVASATGEAAPENIKLAAVKLTLNMMAETRAKNRVMYDAMIARTFKDAVKKMEEMKLSKETQDQIGNAARVSAEEINQPETKPAPSAPLTKYVEKLKVALYATGCKNEKDAIQAVESWTGIALDKLDEITEDQAKEVLFAMNS